MISETALFWILGGAFASIGTVFLITTKKVDKSTFEKHCDNSREDKKDMFEKINNMNTKVTEIHTIITQRNIK